MMTMNFRSTLAALLLGTTALPALAADLPSRSAPPAFASAAFETFDPYMIRVRAVGILPDGTGNIDQIVGSRVKTGNAFIPELDLTYFFTKNFAVEAICCLSKHNISVDGLGKVASTWVFPPTVMAQYHFTGLGAFKPYVGVGVNYTHYFDTRTTGVLANTHMKIQDSWGVAAQVGFDYMIDRHWGINVDVKRILMEPKWKDNTAGLTGKAKIDPWVIGAGITYRFGGPEGAVVAKY
jgi:outer membrane protein